MVADRQACDCAHLEQLVSLSTARRLEREFAVNVQAHRVFFDGGVHANGLAAAVLPQQAGLLGGQRFSESAGNDDLFVAVNNAKDAAVARKKAVFSDGLDLEFDIEVFKHDDRPYT